ncbi:MAG: DNA-binding response regulator [Gammaproteobacteria bacterium]|nr:MAG: DNA-binding response regulator [Gammaproteobacteria bacterium]
MTLRLIIADDHPLFRAAIRQVIAQQWPDAKIIEAANVDQIQQAAEQSGSELDLLILDLHMPGALGFSALSWFTGHYPDTPVVMISANTHPDTVSRAIDLGAAAFVTKSAEMDSIVECLQKVLAGERNLHPTLTADGQGASMQSLDVADALASLTPQQFRVLSMLAEGLLNKQIAYELNVKEATIKAHMTEILRKLKVNSRTQAVLALGSLAANPPAEMNACPEEE